MDTLAIIKRIEIRLSEIGMSKKEFYDKTGIKSASFSQWRTRKYNPSEKNLMKAAEVLGISYNYLVYGTEEPKNAPVESDKRTVSDDEIKFALFGGSGDITDAMYEEVKNFAAYVKQREDSKKKKE